MLHFRFESAKNNPRSVKVKQKKILKDREDNKKFSNKERYIKDRLRKAKSNEDVKTALADLWLDRLQGSRERAFNLLQGVLGCDEIVEKLQFLLINGYGSNPRSIINASLDYSIIVLVSGIEDQG